jgi:hypothetical protein
LVENNIKKETRLHSSNKTQEGIQFTEAWKFGYIVYALVLFRDSREINMVANCTYRQTYTGRSKLRFVFLSNTEYL